MVLGLGAKIFVVVKYENGTPGTCAIEGPLIEEALSFSGKSPERWEAMPHSAVKGARHVENAKSR
jgi:hypothetical protein